MVNCFSLVYVGLFVWVILFTILWYVWSSGPCLSWQSGFQKSVIIPKSRVLWNDRHERNNAKGGCAYGKQRAEQRERYLEREADVFLHSRREYRSNGQIITT